MTQLRQCSAHYELRHDNELYFVSVYVDANDQCDITYIKRGSKNGYVVSLKSFPLQSEILLHFNPKNL